MALIINFIRRMFSSILTLIFLLLLLALALIVIYIGIVVIYKIILWLLATAPVQNFIAAHQLGVALFGLGLTFIIIILVLSYLFNI